MRAALAAALVLGLTAAPVAAAEPPPTPLVAKVRAWRATHEKAILAELADLLALPNVATDAQAIERNASALTVMLERRGFTVRRLAAGEGTPPSLFAVLPSPNAARRVVFYAHYDGQPVTPSEWRSDPFRPVLRAGPELTSPEVDLATAATLDT